MAEPFERSVRRRLKWPAEQNARSRIPAAEVAAAARAECQSRESEPGLS